MKRLAVSLTKTYRKHFEHPVVSVLRLQGTIAAQRGDVMTMIELPYPGQARPGQVRAD